MSDLNSLKNLLKNFGVPFFVQHDVDSSFSLFVGDDTDEHGAYGNSGEDHDKVKGYPGFYTKFKFDEDGAFVYVGAWE